ncbi:hypothetical protein BP5796_10847 [Coleophoma crateriformis]|uniref:Glycosyl hydrolase family 32 N-terminal domain-containing protein n=1 Tax=Coleophoma crateriformis TaxID=565419 RepID=A0A3D8QL65_9HELO|nr:hypothetical protein BP5796_10847 [Coleophoma crateriformis]
MLSLFSQFSIRQTSHKILVLLVLSLLGFFLFVAMRESTLWAAASTAFVSVAAATGHNYGFGTNSAVSVATTTNGSQNGASLYSGPLRPQIHYSPPVNFMNDPNGAFVDANGTWHLYYQYNPTEIVAGNQHWGHATSPDLYHWTNHEIAISPENKYEGIFSGSAVVDVNNTSGFFPNQTNGVVAIYTLNTNVSETQQLAYSHDGGYTFTKYSGNPVIDIGSSQFRDPKVIWYEDHWVMSIAYARDFVIGIYTSPDLKSWTHASNISHVGFLGLQYECPNLVKIPMDGETEDTYLLIISINPGAPQGGSFTQYFPGTFNGTHFTPFDGAARILDFGKDNYAGQFFYDSDAHTPGGEPVFVGWASNWQYTQQVPTGPLEGWRSAMTLPRTARLISNATRIGYDLVTRPYAELAPVKGAQLAHSDSVSNSSMQVNYANLTSGAVYFQVTVTNVPNNTFAMGTLNFTFTASASGETLSGGYFFGGDTPFWVNRGKVRGLDNPFFTDKFSTVYLLPETSNTFVLEGVLDRSILELELGGTGARGSELGTLLAYPEARFDALNIASAGVNEGVSVSAAVWALNSVWS